MLSEEDFKCKYLQCPITFLTEENLDKLETHCRKAANFERGVEHKVVLELLERYYQYQKEIQDKKNKITKLKKENEENKYLYQKALSDVVSADKENIELKKQIDLMAEYIDGDDTSLANYLFRKNGECNKEMIKQYFENKVKEEKINE